MAGAYPGVSTPTPRRWRRKHTLGCFGSLVALVIAVALVQILITPWAFHMGGSLTPLMSWSGVASGTVPGGGGSYAVRINISANTIGDHACSQFGCDDFHGSLDLCTASGTFTFNNLSGTVGGWASTDKQKMRVSVQGASTNGVAHDLNFQFDGVWHGKIYQATDGGYVARDFNPDGTVRSQLGSAVLADAMQLAFQPGDFARACAQVRH